MKKFHSKLKQRGILEDLGIKTHPFIISPTKSISCLKKQKSKKIPKDSVSIYFDSIAVALVQ